MLISNSFVDVFVSLAVHGFCNMGALTAFIFFNILYVCITFMSSVLVACFTVLDK